KPRTRPTNNDIGASTRSSRKIPAAIRREVWRRDCGQCSFVSAAGHRCAAESLLEFHHLDPWGMAGGHAAKTITLRCRAHKQYQAEIDYGAGFMEAKRARESAVPGAPGDSRA